jgi:uncharacterized membrane protein
MRGLRIAGVPLHPLLVHFPVVAWCLLPVLDAAAALGAPPGVPEVARATAIFGVVTALPAMAAGLMDLVALPDEALKARALVHMQWMSAAFTLALIALVLRAQPAVPAAGVFAVDLLAFAGLAIGGHHGARLVYRYGAGVEPPAR